MGLLWRLGNGIGNWDMGKVKRKMKPTILGNLNGIALGWDMGNGIRNWAK